MKTFGKHTLIGWSWRILLWVALTPILLFLLLAVLIYVPPVQKFAVDKAAEILSEEMDMQVTVESVHLKFPLDLAMGGVVAVQDGDTLLAARELDVSVRALPLFRLQAEVDGVHLYDTQLNTKDLIEACVVRGHVAEVSLNSHSTDLQQELAIINQALLRDADLTVLLADSVPEDTTVSEPVNWKIQVEDLQLENVKATVLLPPQADSTYAMLHVGTAHANAFLDLGKEEYRVGHLEAQRSSASFDLRNAPRLSDQLDPSHLLFNDISLAVDSFCFRGTGEMTLNLTQLAATEQSGLTITEAHGRVEMDSLSLHLPRFAVKTADSDFTLAYHMDMNAFDDVNPGTFSALAEGQLGKDDLIYFTRMGGPDTKDVCDMMRQLLPARPTEVQLKADGNLNTLSVSHMYMKVPSLVTLDGEVTLWDVVNDLSLQAKVAANDAHGGSAQLDGSFRMTDEAYKANITLKNLVLNHFMPMDERTFLSGTAAAHGHGFDFLSRGTALSAKAHLSHAGMGRINLSNINADASLQGQQLQLALTAENDQVQTSLTFDGTLKQRLVEGLLDLDLPFLDAQGMGFSEERLQASTKGNAHFSYNLDKLFRFDSQIDALTLLLGSDSIQTDAFYLYAEAQQDTTAATLRTGDLSFDFFTPNNVFDLLPKVEKLGNEAMKQFKQREVKLDELKHYLPELSLHANAGQKNPVSDILRTYGFSFQDFAADVEASPVDGLMGKGHVYAFKADSLQVDTAFFRIVQDSVQLDYHVGVRCHEQAQLPAFRAYLDGYLMADRADAHLTYFDKHDRKGVDLGLKALANDSSVNISLYPQKPILAYREFALNTDNYITTRPNRPITADVRLTSTSDSCYIALFADESDLGNQIANIVVNDMNIKELLSVVPVPGLPSMGGMLNLDAYYIDHGENFSVEGNLAVNRFLYENQRVGDLASQFTYTPQGETLHTIDASLSYNDTPIAQLDGSYEAEGNGALDARLSLLDVPMSMISPFIPDQIVSFSGALAGNIHVTGPTDSLLFNGALLPKDVHVLSTPYSLDFALANDSIPFTDSRMLFNNFNFYGADTTPLTLNGHVDFSNFEEISMALSLIGHNFKVIDAKRSNKSMLFGKLYGDFFARVIGTTNDLTIRGLVKVLSTTDLTYIMSETPLYQGDRLDDIVTFVDFSLPPPPPDELETKTFMGIDMNMVLAIEDGARLTGEFSADKQSYVNVQGGGSITMTYTPEGVLNLQGRYTINEGEMKYTLPVIPLKTFTIHNGSYIEFNGPPMNPVLNVAATERTKAPVGQSDGTSRSVAFDVGLKITNSLDNMGLEFTIEAPEDMAVQNELASLSPEEKNKLAVAMLATGMYLSSTNSQGFTASNALNNFLQSEINNIAGKAMSTMVDVNVGMEQTTRDDGTTRTDYSFQFSRRFFSDRLNVIIGGKVSADGNTEQNESGAYINDVSLEWRLDNGGTQYVRLFHEKDFSNLLEGELDKNGAGILLRKKVDKLSDLLIWRKKEETLPTRAGAAPTNGGRTPMQRGNAPTSEANTPNQEANPTNKE